MFARISCRTAAILAGVTASFMIASPPALAQDDDLVVRGIPEDVKVERVSFRDLNLRYIAHLNILNKRVERAVRNVCDFEPGTIVKSSYKDCADAAWASARPQMHMAYLRANRLASR